MWLGMKATFGQVEIRWYGCVRQARQGPVTLEITALCLLESLFPPPQICCTTYSSIYCPTMISTRSKWTIHPRLMLIALYTLLRASAVSKLMSWRCACGEGIMNRGIDWLRRLSRLMSDYEVSLVNDSMQEFYVRFHGPEESEYQSSTTLTELTRVNSTVRQRSMEDSCRATWSIPIQVTEYRVHEQDIPPKYRWTVRSVFLVCRLLLRLIPCVARSGSVCLDVINQTWSPMFGVYLSFVLLRCIWRCEASTFWFPIAGHRYDQYIWSLSSSAPTVSQSQWSLERWGCCLAHATPKGLWSQGQGYVGEVLFWNRIGFSLYF